MELRGARLHVIVLIASLTRLAAGSSDVAHHQNGLRGADLHAIRSNPHPHRAPRRSAALLADQPADQPAPASPEAASPTQEPTMTTPAGLLVPQPNDTISAEYWSTVNRAIYEAGLSTPAPKSLNDKPSTQAPEPFRKIFEASQNIEVADTPQDQENMNDWHADTPEPPEGGSAMSSDHVRAIGVVPYDMALGARILYALNPKNTPTPPPTQEYINEAFVAQCPMVMTPGIIEVKAPRCESSLGEWQDPKDGRNILRWSNNKQGGLVFSVDSATTGNGSVVYAELNERLTWNKYEFDLLNCVGTMRYHVEEQVIKVSSDPIEGTGQGGTSFFYKYIILDGSNTPVADSGLVRMDQDEVKFTSVGEGVGLGKVVAAASRSGEWTRSGWRTCDSVDRGWMVTFPSDYKHFTSAATVQDIRIASAVAITLMAFRDESVGSDGFHHSGQGYLYWEIVRAIFWVIFGLLVASIVWIVWTRKSFDKSVWRFLNKVEAVFLPKRPSSQRHATLY